MTFNLEAIRTVGDSAPMEISKFRSAAVTSENRATPLARSLLGALVAGTATPALVVSMVIHAFGNPKTPKGKAIDKLSGSGDYLPGWGATRKTVTGILALFENIDVDAPRNVEVDGETVIVGEGKVRETIVSFILEGEGSPRSFRALQEAVRAHVSAFTASLSPDNSEAEAEAEGAAAEERGEAPAKSMTLKERAEALIVAYGAASPEERAEAQDALTALFLAVDADISAAGSETPAEAETVAEAA